jgi:hypothetical protein
MLYPVNPRSFFHLTNCLKGMFCGILVWIVVFGIHRYVFSQPLLRPLRTPFLLLGPLMLYPPLLWVVLRYQLPPLSEAYIKAKWNLWIPGYLIAVLPTLDILFLGRRLIRLILG